MGHDGRAGEALLEDASDVQDLRRMRGQDHLEQVLHDQPVLRLRAYLVLILLTYILIMIDKITNKERVKYQLCDITLTPLDARCNALRIEVQQGEMRFEETISVYDFVDIKKLLRVGKKLKEINEYSLLFVKLMISTGAASKKM